MTKQRILDEIRRMAAANGGRPPGRERFEREAGVREAEWYPHHWLRWGEALLDAGFAPNKLQDRLSDDVVLKSYVALVNELGHIPVTGELRIKARADASFPSHNTFQRFGSKAALAAKAAEYCRGRSELANILPLFEAASQGAVETTKSGKVSTGVVYLMKSGRHFKIGRTNSIGRREWELGIKIPIPPKTIHYIETDDPAGVEAYWHRRFADRRGEGEWFVLSAEDVAAFKRWKRIV